MVKPSRSFLRWIIELSKVVKKNHNHIRLNASFPSDLEWWATFLPVRNGVGMLSNLCHCPHTVAVTSDASGGWGCGAYLTGGKWFQFAWPDEWLPVHITVKELLPMVMACALWGHMWERELVLAHTDNAAVVATVNSGRSKDALAMHLMRYFFFLSASHSYSLKPSSQYDASPPRCDATRCDVVRLSLRIDFFLFWGTSYDLSQ